MFALQILCIHAPNLKDTIVHVRAKKGNISKFVLHCQMKIWKYIHV